MMIVLWENFLQKIVLPASVDDKKAPTAAATTTRKTFSSVAHNNQTAFSSLLPTIGHDRVTRRTMMIQQPGTPTVGVSPVLRVVQPQILACSVARNSSSSSRRSSSSSFDSVTGRYYGQDRKAFWAHMTPGALVKSTIRITLMSSTTIATQYLNDQLQEDLKRDERVAAGVLTLGQAQRQADEWAEDEWKRRWSNFPTKLGIALLKYHAVTFCMRLYERIASYYVSPKRLDALTLDTFTYSQELSVRQKNNRTVFSEMLVVSWDANIIAFLADYSVHQLILLAGFYLYTRKKSKERRAIEDDKEEDLNGGLVLSLAKKSSALAVSRLLGLSLGAVGGAFGSLLYPGWGTLAGINFGDSMALTLLDQP